MANPVVRRLDFGYFVRPADETGTGRAVSSAGSRS